MLTITSNLNKTNEKEERIDYPFLFPCESEERPCVFTNKKYIFITARIHAAETPSSYFVRGILNFLSEDSEESRIFLDNFVVLIIPMLNPDGVVRGHYRLDA